MKTTKIKTLFFFVFLVLFLMPVQLWADDSRAVPLDLYLIIDTSERFRETSGEIISWINEQYIDGVLQEGDRLVIWSTGNTARIIYTETIGSGTSEAKDTLRNLEIGGANADFSGALREATSRAASDSANRLSLTLLISSSAENLAPSLGNGSAGLFRWSRVAQYSRWQALVVAPAIDAEVRRAAAAYMAGR
jgi:hypothetical protein